MYFAVFVKRKVLLKENICCRPRWFSRMRVRSGDRGLDSRQVWQHSFMKINHEIFLLSFSPFRWFKKGACKPLRRLSLPRKSVDNKLTALDLTLMSWLACASLLSEFVSYIVLHGWTFYVFRINLFSEEACVQESKQEVKSHANSGRSSSKCIKSLSIHTRTRCNSVLHLVLSRSL